MKKPLLVLFSALAAATLVCKQSTLSDWSEFTEATIKGSLEALAAAESIYIDIANTSGIDSACAAAARYLTDEPAVDSAGIEEDSTVWVEFANGMSGSIVETTWGKGGESLFYLPRSEAPARTQGGGEATPSCVILVPFSTELPGTNPGPITDWLDTCFGGPEPATEVYKDAAVDVDKVEEVLMSGTGMLIWAGHGFLRAPRMGSTDKVCVLMTGESYSEADRAAGVIKTKYGDQMSGSGRELTVVMHKGLFYMAIFPAFVTAHGNFDVLEGFGVNQCKSLAYISCCYSLRGMQEAFMGRGVDVYWGWTWAADDSFAGEMDREMFRQLTDTCTAGEATEVTRGSMGYNSPSYYRGRRARFYMAGDSAVMVRSRMDFDRDGSPLHGYSVGIAMASGFTTVNCFAGQPFQEPEYGVTVHFPGAGAGSWNCLSAEDALIGIASLTSGKFYVVQKGYVGVDGTIEVDRYDDKILSGRFTGTLGWWAIGLDPEEDPPTETIEIQNGIFKHSGPRQ
jgi:hypothetical protein